MFRRARRSAAAAFVVALMTLWYSATFSGIWAQCWSGEGVATIGRTDRGYVTADGIHHVTYKIPDGWGTNLRARIQDAVNQWNSKTSTTKVVFEEYDPEIGPYPDMPPSIQFDTLSAAELSCGRYSGGDNQRIYLHPNWLTAAANQTVASENLAQVVAHEMGHPLNLDHSDTDGRIMKVPSYASCTTTAMNSFPGTTVQDADANAAVPCIAQARSGVGVFSGNENENDLDYYEEDCWNLYRIYWGWEYVGNGQFEAVVYATVLIDSGCGPPPI